MQLGDTINGLFELYGAFAAFQNVRALRRDRAVAGIYWPNFLFYSAWGLWNLGYYPSLGQWLSFTGGCFIVAANLTWVGHYFWYRNATEKQTA